MKQIPLSCPDLTEAERLAVQAVLRTNRLSLGPHAEGFEAAVAERAGRKHGIAVNSGTSGLHLCVRALGIGPDDEVITTPFSFVATTNCFLYEGARPVFVDIDPETYNLDPEGIEAAITPRTRAIIPVEVFGNMAHFPAYERIAAEHGLAMIEDCCEALGGRLGDRPAGSFGDCGAFGFYPNKQVTCGEGGMIVTDDDRIAELCRSMRNQGRDSDQWGLHERLGYNYRMSEITAALGLAQMRRLDEILQRRREVAAMYQEALADVEEIRLPPCADPEQASWFVYVVRLDERFSAQDRAELLRLLQERGIGCDGYFPAIHLQPFIREHFGFRRGDFPRCEHLADRTVALPFFTAMKAEQVEVVADHLRRSLLEISSKPVRVRVAPAKTKRRVRPRQVPFYRVACDGNELRYVAEVLGSGWLTTATKTFEFERRFAAAVGAKYAVAVSSCTAALHLALEAIGIQPGERVFVPTMTFTSSAGVTRYLGADPLLLDVEYGTSLLTPEILERAVAEHPDVKALVIVHFGGQPAAMLEENRRGILDICREHGIRVVEDAAHAFPARIRGKTVGSLGDATCFSFYANKTITSAEGGMLTTNDKQIAERASLMRLHGMDREAWDRFTSPKPQWEYDIIAPGFKCNLSDVHAAIGLAQLERARALWDQRFRCVKYYYERLAEIPCLELPVCRVPMEDHAWHLFVVNLRPEAPLTRNELIEALAERGIVTSIHYKPLHRMSYYQKRYGLSPEQFPNAERIWQGCLSLPLFPTMSEEDLDYVCSTLKELLS